jgi:hypothetical protein
MAFKPSETLLQAQQDQINTSASSSQPVKGFKKIILIIRNINKIKILL